MSTWAEAARLLLKTAQGAPKATAAVVFVAIKLLQSIKLPNVTSAATLAAFALARAVDLVYLAVKPSPSMSTRVSKGCVKNVAVIGAGASGITAAK